jgi:glutaminase
MDSLSIAKLAGWPCISTGHLPEPETVQKLVSDAHLRFKSNTDGQNSQVYPALARVPSELFGVCVVGTMRRVYGAGEIEFEFSIKERVFALVCETLRPGRGARKIRSDATGLPFNSLAAIEQGGGRRAWRPARPQKIGLLLMAGLALLALIPAGQLPNYLPGGIPADQPTGKGSRLT